MAGVLAIVGLPALAESAAAAVTLQCQPSVTIFGVSTDDRMWVNQHNTPETGADDMTHLGQLGGGSWTGRVLAGHNGQVFRLPDNGEVLRYRWNGSSFSTAEVIDTGRWYGWSHPANHKRITVDANNHIYNVLSNGTLEINIYNETTKTWTTRALATDWNKYDLITAAGNGVIYARDPNVADGQLVRYQYDAANQRWLGFDRRLGDGGWNWHREIFSPGGDILYGVTRDTARLTEYRYDAHNDTWPIGRADLTTGWGDLDNVTATTNACGTTTPSDAVVQCEPDVTIFGVAADGGMWVNQHNEPETGITDMRGLGRVDGGWTGRVLAGHNGQVFRLPDNGEVLRYRWNGSSFTGPEVIDTGRWHGWTNPANRNRITVDANNHIYNVLSNGTLEINIYNETTKTWTTRALADDWGKYDLITAAGNGVLYARDPNISGGVLFRYQYDVTTGRWLSFNQQLSGSGWSWHREIFSPGGDVIYGVTSDTARLVEYRYDPKTGTWPLSNANLTVGWGALSSVGATSNACVLREPATVTRPTVPAYQHERAQALLNTANGMLEVVYTSREGALKRGFQTSTGSEFIHMQAMSGGDAGGVLFTGRASAAFRADGRLMIVGHRTNADAYTYTQKQVGGAHWDEPVDVRGAMLSAPQLVKGAGGLLTAYSVDGQGRLWYAPQVSATGGLLPWRQAGGAGGSAISPDFTVLAAGDAAEIVYRTTSNAVEVRRFANGTLAAARVASGLTAAGLPGGVLFADGKVQVVAKGADNLLYTQKEGASGFGGWQLIGGLTVKGSPSVVLNPHGIVEVAARGDDDLVFRTGQTAPGSTTWRQWESNYDYQQTATSDPTLVMVSGTEARIFYLGPNTTYFLLQQTPYTSDPGSAMTASSARTSKQTREVESEVTTGSTE